MKQVGRLRDIRNDHDLKQKDLERCCMSVKRLILIMN